MKGMLWYQQIFSAHMFLCVFCFLQLMAPEKILIPERYLDMEDNVPISHEEQKEKQKKTWEDKNSHCKITVSFNSALRV